MREWVEPIDSCWFVTDSFSHPWIKSEKCYCIATGSPTDRQIQIEKYHLNTSKKHEDFFPLKNEKRNTNVITISSGFDNASKTSSSRSVTEVFFFFLKYH